MVAPISFHKLWLRAGIAVGFQKICVRAGIAVALFGLAMVLGYVVAGHSVIKLIYESHLPVVEKILEARAIIPLALYYDVGDKVVLTLAIYFVVGGVLWAIFAKDPLGLALSGTSLLAGSLGIFLILDLVPALVKPLHFDMIPYFNFRLTYVPDPVLGFREKPFRHDEITNFRGFGYSPLYGIDVSPQKLVWQTDGEGFRNSPGDSAADIVIIGSSFAEYGTDLENTYGRQLQNMSGYSVVNLGKAGYGPLQYAELLKRYAINKKPQIVIFTVYPSVDIEGHVIDWLKGKEDGSLKKRRVAFGGFLSRYSVAVHQAWEMLSTASSSSLQVWLQNAVGTKVTHPDVSVLKLPDGETTKVVFMDHHTPKSADDRLRSPEWKKWEALLAEWKDITDQNNIVPIILYIPAATEIYSEYSTTESGENWLRVRDSLVQTSGSNEEAMRTVAASFGINMISLRAPYQDAARKGRVVYYSLDAHWNEEGRELAARVTAEALKSYRLAPPKSQRPGFEVTTGPSNESVIERTMNGLITFWDPHAEELYGWKKEQAIGKITHALLRTQFPEPLELINAELSTRGRWEGQLVHTTQDGHQVVVGSRWFLDRNSDSEVVIEINTPSAKSDLQAHNSNHQLLR